MAIGAIDTAAVIGGIQLASARTGVDFDYLLATAKVESGLDPAAAAPTSSARGLYQFTEGTWLDTVRKHGGEHGLGWAADALKAGADPATRAAILDLRKVPAASASMAAALASDNGTSLEHRLGRAVGATDLYLAHFLGAGGAARFLRARDADPTASARGAVLPAAARANAGVFTAKGGRERSLGEVYDRFSARLGASSSGRTAERANPLPTGNAVPRTGNIVPADAPRAARMAYLMLAEFGA